MEENNFLYSSIGVTFIFDSVQCTLGTGEWAGVVGCCRHAAVSAVLVVNTKMGPAVVKWHTTVAWATSTGVTWSWAKKVETVADTRV